MTPLFFAPSFRRISSISILFAALMTSPGLASYEEGRVVKDFFVEVTFDWKKCAETLVFGPPVWDPAGFIGSICAAKTKGLYRNDYVLGDASHKLDNCTLFFPGGFEDYKIYVKKENLEACKEEMMTHDKVIKIWVRGSRKTAGKETDSKEFEGLDLPTQSKPH